MRDAYQEWIDAITAAIPGDHALAHKILATWKADHCNELTADIPGEFICGDSCVRAIGEYQLSQIAEAYGVAPATAYGIGDVDE